MPLRLRDNVHWCDCGGRAVFLDLEEDRYFCLSKSANDAFLRAANKQTQSGDAERLHAMVARGLLLETSVGCVIDRPPCIERPTCDHAAAPAGELGLADLLKAFAAEIRAVRLLRRKPLRQAIAAAATPGRQRANAASGCESCLRRIIAASNTISLVTRTHNRCLARALAVHSMCRKRGIGPKLVFGVIAHPFAAHCWVQLGSAVLVGGFEQARLYSPILVIE